MRIRRKNRQELSEAPAGYNRSYISAIFVTMGNHPHTYRNKAHAGIKLRAASLACDHEGWAADTSGQVSGQPERSQPSG